jgi:hypothetical protein
MKQRFAFALIMVSVTTGLVSFTLIATTKGFGSAFLVTWFRSWAISYLPAFFSVFFIAPFVQRLVQTAFAGKGLIRGSL